MRFKTRLRGGCRPSVRRKACQSISLTLKKLLALVCQRLLKHLLLLFYKGSLKYATPPSTRLLKPSTPSFVVVKTSHSSLLALDGESIDTESLGLRIQLYMHTLLTLWSHAVHNNPAFQMRDKICKGFYGKSTELMLLVALLR